MDGRSVTLETFKEQIAKLDPINYGSVRNHIGKSSQISQHLTRGVVTLPQVVSSLTAKASVKQMDKYVFELGWREYYQRVWDIKGDDILSDLKWPQPKAERQGVPLAVLNAETGIDALDKAIKKLYDTGYIHNHERMWLAGLVCNVARCGWFDGAQWMYSHLKDGDIASNHLSWQWVAASFSNKTYLPAQSNIDKFTNSKQFGSYLDQDYPALNKMAIPAQLQEVQRFSMATAMPKPDIDIKDIDMSLPTNLYSPWTLNPAWQTEAAQKLLVIEPSVFAKHPVSKVVMNHIVQTARHIEGLKIYVGESSDLSGLKQGDAKYYPLAKDYPAAIEDPDWLFPEVEHTYYASFTSFWKHAEKQLDDLQRRCGQNLSLL